MSHDAISSWLEKAKNAEAQSGGVEQADGAVRVIKNTYVPSKGSVIMEVAEMLRPLLSKMFDGVRDQGGMPVQPAHVRGLALDVAQRIVHEQEKKASA